MCRHVRDGRGQPVPHSSPVVVAGAYFGQFGFRDADLSGGGVHRTHTGLQLVFVDVVVVEHGGGRGDLLHVSGEGLDLRIPHTCEVRVDTAVAVDGGLVAGRDAERSDPEMDRCVLDTLDQVVLVHGTQHGEGGAAIGQRPVARREHTLPIHTRLCVDLGELHLEVLMNYDLCTIDCGVVSLLDAVEDDLKGGAKVVPLVRVPLQRDGPVPVDPVCMGERDAGAHQNRERRPVALPSRVPRKGSRAPVPLKPELGRDARPFTVTRTWGDALIERDHCARIDRIVVVEQEVDLHVGVQRLGFRHLAGDLVDEPPTSST